MVCRSAGRIGKGFVANAMGFPGIQAIDRVIGAVVRKPIEAEKGRIPDNARASWQGSGRRLIKRIHR
jgi:hypothetical protein